MLKHLPNFLTLCNLSCGFVGIIFCFWGLIDVSFYLILLAALLDFFDGFAARALKAYSNIGKDLDSLADCITFGVLPGFLVFSLFHNQQFPLTYEQVNPWAFSAVLIPAFSALRLAIFNNDTRQSESFIGVPTPANTLFIAGIALAYYQGQEIVQQLSMFYTASVLSLVGSLWLVMPQELIALKFKNFQPSKENLYRYIVIGAGLLLLISFPLSLAISTTIMVYIGGSIVKNILSK